MFSGARRNGASRPTRLTSPRLRRYKRSPKSLDLMATLTQPRTHNSSVLSINIIEHQNQLPNSTDQLINTNHGFRQSDRLRSYRQERINHSPNSQQERRQSLPCHARPKETHPRSLPGSRTSRQIHTNDSKQTSPTPTPSAPPCKSPEPKQPSCT